jgi:hypothetical protein
MAEIATTSDRAVFVATGGNSTETALNIKKQCLLYELFCMKLIYK